MVDSRVKFQSKSENGHEKRWPSRYLGVAMASLLASSVCLSSSFAQVKTASALPAGTPAAPGLPPKTQEIDIQAAEQDFMGDQVVVKGNVRVKSKDTVVTGPEAKIFKDAGGQPQLAIFTGHPHLVQGKNKIDADTLTFEIATNKVIAEGHAHSEVVGNEDPNAPGAAGGAAAGASPAPTAGGGMSSPMLTKGAAPKGKNGAPFDWPTVDGDKATGRTGTAKPVPIAKAPAPAPIPAPAPKPKPKADSSGWQMDDETEAPAPAAAAPVATAAAAAPAAAPAQKPPDKIVTDSNHQEYDSDTGHFFAKGNVRVKHLDMKVLADQLNLVYGNDGKPETAVFTGNVSATQNDNNTKADTVTYFLSTQRLQASGNVRSKVIQQRQKASGASSQEVAKKGGPKSPNGNQTADADPDKGEPGAGTGRGSKKGGGADRAKVVDVTPDSSLPIFILSDAQDYNKETGRMTAVGSVRVYYSDSKGVGHKAVLLRNEDGKTQKIFFYGRSQITQPGKRWIGDQIEFNVPSEKVVCSGNTKAIILNTKAKLASTQTSSDEGVAPSDQGPDTNTNSQVDARLANYKEKANNADSPDGVSKKRSGESNASASQDSLNVLNSDRENMTNDDGSQISTTTVDPTR